MFKKKDKKDQAQSYEISPEHILEVRNLNVRISVDDYLLHAVRGVNFSLKKGETLGLVGESGCGKSVTSKEILGINPDNCKSEGQILYRTKSGKVLNLLELEHDGATYRTIRGSEISMIFQEPMTSLNPVMKVGKQVDEAVRLHTDCTREEAKARVLEIFREVEIPEPEVRYDCYPHQLSGGLRQRVLIAMAAVCRPKLLIADEPTTALDVTVEAQILSLLERLRDAGVSVLLISHNLGVIDRVCDYVFVMYAGRIVEQAGTEALFERPRHPYTRGLFRAVASLREGGDALETIPGVVPNLLHLPAGCSFSLRCASCRSDCERRLPALAETEPGHKVRCFLAGEGGAR